MSNLVRNGIILLAIVAICIWAIYPPEKKIRLGKDVQGGVSLLYGVDIKPSDDKDTLAKVRTSIADRLDPSGVLEIGITPVGTDRLEITMPLPSERVKKLQADFDDALAKVGTAALNKEELERIAQMPEPQRTEALKPYAGTDAERMDKLNRAILDFESLKKARAEYEPVAAQVKFLKEQIRNAGGDAASNPVVTGLKDALKAQEEKAKTLVTIAAGSELAYADSSQKAISAGLSAADLRRALNLSDKPFKLRDKEGKVATLDSPRKRAVEEFLKQFPNQKDAITAAIAKWNAYESERSGLDDPEDVVRILKGAGVLDFRITVNPGDLPGENDFRTQLRAGGPRSVKAEDAKFFKVNKIEAWVQTVDELDALKQSPAAYFANRRLVAEEYKGAYYVLCWDKRGSRLTHAPEDGQWTLAKATQGADQLGRSAIDFEMDVLGADKLGRLTENNINKNMAVLLDDEVYTAPNLLSRISNKGQITGTFSQPEIEYIVRVLSAGSLKAKLSSEPISRTVIGPSLGKENLDKGLRAGFIAFIVVGSFMVLYYFTCGAVSIVALALNALMLVGAMALNQAAFTLPGIAGIILTFGMAVDANVLIYERMREELNLGHDLRTAVRLGYSRALSAIVDGHVTSLIAAVVLGFTGTQEIKGFALTLGIGIVTSLFSQLFATRFLFTILVEKFHVRHLTMLSMAMKWKLQPHIDWLGIRGISYAISFLIVLMGVGFLVVQNKNLLGTEFRGGTAVTLIFKNNIAPDGTVTPVVMARHDVEEKVHDIGKKAPEGSPLKEFIEAEIIAVNPLPPDGKTSQTFTIKTLVTDPKVVQEVLVQSFIDKLDIRQALKFDGSDLTADRAPVVLLTSPNVGDAIDKPGKGGSAPDFVGGAAITLDHITPPVSKAELEARLKAARLKHEFAEIASRPWEIRVLDGTNERVESAVILVRDPDVRDDKHRWEGEVRDREWALAAAALTQTSTLAEVQSFSPAVASTFRAQAIIAVVFSTLLIIIYVWVRFNSFRYSAAAIVCTLHDCLVAIGFVGLASWLYDTEATRGFATAIGILPFKIDLNVVAAVLTILGYSLNDTIIVMDRIRENRGKLPYASRKVINDAINQTISRTIITAGTTFLATMVLYIFGGEGVRVFAYTMLIGILVGTYSSIAVAAPLLWVKAMDPHEGTGVGGALPETGRAAA